MDDWVTGGGSQKRRLDRQAGWVRWEEELGSSAVPLGGSGKVQSKGSLFKFYFSKVKLRLVVM